MNLPKTFADIPNRDWALETLEARSLLDSMPSRVRNMLFQYYLNPSNFSSPELLDYFSNNSSFWHLTQKNPGTALAFEILYTRNASTPIDNYCIECKAGLQIYQRLLALEANLPTWINRLLNSKQSVLVDNIGSGTGRDMIGVLSKNPHFTKKVKIRNIDPDTESLAISVKLAQETGVSESFSFHSAKFSDVQPAEADLVLLIGILCPLHRRVSKVVLKSISRYVRGGVWLSTP